MKRLSSLLVTLAAMLLASAPLALAQGTYTQIDYPGALDTEGLAIDTAGDATGLYVDSSDNYHGFLLSNGSYTTIDYPGALVTYLTGINDEGQIVGAGRVPNIGFLYDVQTQAFTIINRPGASLTYPGVINNGGQIAGLLVYGNAETDVGFELINSKYKIISPPTGSQPYIFGITASGTLFGAAYNTSGGTLYFSYSNGKYSPFTIPNAPGYVVSGVSPQGSALVGYYNPSSGTTAGFIYQQKVLTTLQFPGASDTYAFGINAAGEVVGLFDDAEGNGHGFTWTPPAPLERK